LITYWGYPNPRKHLKLTTNNKKSNSSSIGTFLKLRVIQPIRISSNSIIKSKFSHSRIQIPLMTWWVDKLIERLPGTLSGPWTGGQAATLRGSTSGGIWTLRSRMRRSWKKWSTS
jgi:hypothetical protein